MEQREPMKESAVMLFTVFSEWWNNPGLVFVFSEEASEYMDYIVYVYASAQEQTLVQTKLGHGPSCQTWFALIKQ